MKICRVSRPPIRTLFEHFPQTRNRILNRGEMREHEIHELVIRPVRMPTPYLTYGLGILLSPLRFRGIRADLILADDIESGIAALLLKLTYRIPLVFNFIDDYSLIASYDHRRLRYWGLKFFEKTIPRLADRVIVVDLMKKQYCLDLGIPESKLRLVPNGVDTAVFKPEPPDVRLRDRMGLTGGPMVLYVGKVNKYYELETLLKAVPAVLAEFPQVRFLWVGDGDHLDHLKGLSDQLGITPAVVFTGFRPPAEIPNLINLSDLCVFPLPDSSALAIFEYMACAKPVVLPRGGTKKMGIPREMIPEDCVLQVENSPEGFAKGIKLLLKNKGIAEEIGRRARELTIRCYDWNILTKRYSAVLQEILVAQRQRTCKKRKW